MGHGAGRRDRGQGGSCRREDEGGGADRAPAEADHGPAAVRGQEAGEVRSDLSADWLVTVVCSLVHAAAAEVQAGRLDAAEAPDLLTTTVLATVRA
ncbi:hypothetical protein ACFXD5_27610 [Streptomyces sp. NPDC059385]|uniref:hypothetical protein n=1 Tax=Streptomyces sp. NPDC059385 TaxID=3346817 RepID=UPI00367DEAA7